MLILGHMHQRHPSLWHCPSVLWLWSVLCWSCRCHRVMVAVSEFIVTVISWWCGLGVDHQLWVVGVGGWAAWCMQGGCPCNGLVIIVSKQKKNIWAGGKLCCMGVSACAGVHIRRCRCACRGPVIIVSIWNKNEKTNLQVRLCCGGGGGVGESGGGVSEGTWWNFGES